MGAYLVRAAMEPAVDRREHDIHFPVEVDLMQAAMEPAVDRREHMPLYGSESNAASLPQWSPR